jgi:hypothetical protein
MTDPSVRDALQELVDATDAYDKAAFEPGGHVVSKAGARLDRAIEDAKAALSKQEAARSNEQANYTQSVADAQDAGRYRWLKDKSGFDIRSLLDVGDFTSLNAHIDAAMALDVTKRDPKGD